MPSRQIPSPIYPSYEVLSPSTKVLMQTADDALKQLSHHASSLLNTSLEQLRKTDEFVDYGQPLASLTHRLSPYVARPMEPSNESAVRSAEEVQILGSMDQELICGLFGSFSEFCDALETISSAVLGGKADIREDFAVGTAYDLNGNRWLYIPQTKVRVELYRLWSFLVVGSERPNTFTAAIFMTNFLGIHPFRDGNGRLSRILANIILFREISTARMFYIPFKDLMMIGQGGFEIACNQARFFGRAAIVCRWISNAILAIFLLQQNDASREGSAVHHHDGAWDSVRSKALS